MKKISFSAPAKIHLLGEHAVVYGKPALLAALDKRLTATIAPSKTESKFVLPGKISMVPLQNALEETIKKRFKLKHIPQYKLTFKSDIPIGAGMGSSAALSATAAACLLSFLDIPVQKKLVFEVAYAGEQHFHGNPSGGDLACVIEGGFLYFRKEFEFLKTFNKLPFKIHNNISHFLVINSGKPEESTKDLILHVKALKAHDPKKVQEVFDEQEDLTKRMVLALKTGDEDELMHCIREGERNLEKLGVVGTKIKKKIREIEKLGGAAKISGGGGIKNGAGMLLVYHPKPKKIKKLEKLVIDYEGLRKEL